MQYTLDLSQARDKDALHALLAQTLPLPSYYGRNLDALFDVLTDAHELWDICFTHCAEAAAALGDYMDAFRATITDAVQEGAEVCARWDDGENPAEPQGAPSAVAEDIDQMGAGTEQFGSLTGGEVI